MSVGSNQRGGALAAWSRIVGVLAIAGLVAFPALVIVAALTFAGGRLGWLPCLLAFCVLGFISGWLAVPTRWPAARARTSVGLAIVGGLLGLAVAHVAPPTYERLRHEIEPLAQPEWRLRAETADGSALCFDYCRSVTRTYVVDASPAEVLEELGPALTSNGFGPAPPPGEDLVIFSHGGSRDVDVSVIVEGAGADEGPTTVRITATAV